MGKTIAIIELYQHDEVLRHYLELLLDSEYNIKIFCSKVVYDCLEDLQQVSSFEWVVKNENQSIPNFLSRKEILIRSSELIFITTAQSHFRAFYQLALANPVFLLIHNVHSFLAPKEHLAFDQPIKDRLRWFRVLLDNSHHYKRKLLSSLAGLAFPNEIVLQYVKTTFHLPSDLPCISLPFAYYKNRSKTEGDTYPFTITIPCTIDPRLRDYESVWDALNDMSKMRQFQLRIILLGKPKGKGVDTQMKFQKLHQDKIEVITFDDYIPTDSYQSYLQQSDLLILPVKEYVSNHMYKERFGYSKITGGINDVIRSGVPTLTPAHYPVEDNLKELVETYNSDELSRLVLNKIELHSKGRSPDSLAVFHQKYNKEQIQKDFFQKLDLILNQV